MGIIVRFIRTRRGRAALPMAENSSDSVRRRPARAHQGPSIIDACKATGAEAVHPGYGFLSERESFAKALAKAGITFIGPPPKAIAAMGDKIESKKLARDAGVNIVPGWLDDIATTEEAVKIAADIGYPVMMKASAAAAEGHAAAWSRKTSAKARQRQERGLIPSARRVFIEKLIEGRDHIEIRCSATSRHRPLFGERECSISAQPESGRGTPSALVSAMRKAMGEQPSRWKRRSLYSAGTVETIVTRDSRARAIL